MRKTCQHCQKDNASAATYCSGCGKFMSKSQPFWVDLLSPDFPKTYVVRDETHRSHLVWAVAASVIMYTLVIMGLASWLMPPRIVRSEASVFSRPSDDYAPAPEASPPSEPVIALAPTESLAGVLSATSLAEALIIYSPTPAAPTSTPLPTPLPTMTSTPLPTNTPSPTITPIPTSTSIPTSTPIPDTSPGSILALSETWRQGGLLATVSGFELLDRNCFYGDPQHLWGRWYIAIENTTDQQLAVDIRAENFFYRDEYGIETVPYMVYGWGNCYFFENGGGFVNITSLNPGERVEIAVYGRGDRGSMSGFQFGIRNINDRIVNATWQVSIPR